MGSGLHHYLKIFRNFLEWLAWLPKAEALGYHFIWILDRGAPSGPGPSRRSESIGANESSLSTALLH